MVGPPPPPPPPPPSKTVLSSGWRKTENAQRSPIQHPTKSSPSISQRPSVDAAALQHAASRLRKTVNNQQIRGDESNISNGGLDRENESINQRDWKNITQFNKLECNQTREQIPSSSSYSNNSRTFGNIRGHTHSLSSESSRPQRFISSSSYTTSDSEPYNKNIISSSSTLYTPMNTIGSSPISTTISSISSSSSSTMTRNESPWVSQIDNTFKESISPPLYAIPNRHSPNLSPSSQQDQGILYSAINKTSNTSSQSYIPPPSNSPIVSSNKSNDFIRQLRDQGLTERQKVANENRESKRRMNDLPFNPNKIIEAAYDGDDISQLIKQMNNGMNVPYITCKQSIKSDNVCVNCNEEVTGDKPGCTALNQIFHVSCFVCGKCGEQLAGSSFYNVDGKPICEKDYVDSLEKCTKCNQSISDRLLRAVGGAFHVQCFTCVVCNIALDGIPFTVDPENRVHCVHCFHEAFAPRCSVCTKPIIPQEGEKESVRVVAMDKSFHVECYRCEDCGVQLSSKIEGQGCYPLDSHLYCKTCNGNRLRLLATS